MTKISKIKIFSAFILFSTLYFLFSSAILAQLDLSATSTQPDIQALVEEQTKLQAERTANLLTIENVKSVFSLTTDSQNPFPDRIIVITANLSRPNANGSNYSWFLNGVRQIEASGSNKNTFAFKAGAIGTVYRVSANVTTPKGKNFSDIIYLTVSDVDITWIANSQTPDDYRAKLMPAHNSLVAVSALPLIYEPGTKNRISSTNLIYNWMLDNKLDASKSGLNRSSYNFTANHFFGNSHQIQLEIKTKNGAVSLIKNAVIPVAKPQILLYFADPKTNRPFGVALKNLTAKPANFNFIALPYFFTAPAENLKWQWLVNNAAVRGETGNPWLATLNLTGNFFGKLSAQIQVIAENPNNELENAQSTTNLEIR